MSEVKTYTFTVEEINKIGELLGECPAKFAMPVVDYLRSLLAQKDAETKSDEK